MDQYIPPTPPAPQPDNSSRQPANAQMNRYIPQDYPPPPPPPPSSHAAAPEQRAQGGPSYAPDTRPRGPSFANQPIPSVPPVPSSYAPAVAVQPPPPGQSQPYPGNSQLQPYPTNTHPNSAIQVQDQYQRRLSAESAHSRPSYESQGSRHSGRASEDRDRRRSHDGADGGDGRDNKPSHKPRHHRGKQPDDRPTLGDTIYGMFDVVKSAFGAEK